MEGILIIWASRNAMGILALVVVLSILGFGFDLHSHGALGFALVAAVVCGGAFLLPSKTLKVISLLVAVGFGLAATKTRSDHVGQVASGRAHDDAVEKVSMDMKADDASQLAILRSMRVEPGTVDAGAAIDRLDDATLGRFAAEYGKARGKVIAAIGGDVLPFAAAHACALVFAAEHRLHGLTPPAPALLQAEAWLRNDFYTKGASRPVWLADVSSVRPAATGDNALPAYAIKYSAAEQVSLAK